MGTGKGKKRGRPRGTTLTRDEGLLFNIAVALEAGQATNLTEAIRLMGETEPSNIRRLHKKFREAEAELRHRAQRYLAPPPPPRRAPDPHRWLLGLDAAKIAQSVGLIGKLDPAFMDNITRSALIGSKMMAGFDVSRIVSAQTTMQRLLERSPLLNPGGVYLELLRRWQRD